MISNPVGALLGGMMVDAVGRRLLLQSIVLPNLIGWLVIAFSETYVFLCVGRFITGFTIGMLACYVIYICKARALQSCDLVLHYPINICMLY